MEDSKEEPQRREIVITPKAEAVASVEKKVGVHYTINASATAAGSGGGA